MGLTVLQPSFPQCATIHPERLQQGVVAIRHIVKLPKRALPIPMLCDGKWMRRVIEKAFGSARGIGENRLTVLVAPDLVVHGYRANLPLRVEG